MRYFTLVSFSASHLMVELECSRQINFPFLVSVNQIAVNYRSWAKFVAYSKPDKSKIF